MRIQQLRAVCEIVQRRFNMSAAAAALHRSQPALSRQIGELERELGVRVFSRTRNKIVGLTAEGEEVLAIGQRITREAEALRHVGSARGDAGLELRIATTHTHARYTLPWVIKQFGEAYPKLLLNLRQGNPAQCFQLVSGGEADLGVTVEIERIPRDIITIPIFKLARAVFAPQGHPIQRGKVTLERIAQYPIVAYTQSPDWKWLFGGAFAVAGLKPSVVLSALDADVSKTYVAMGMGIAVLATITYDPEQDTRLVAIAADHLFRPGVLTLVLRKGAYLTRHMHAFLSAFCPHVDSEFIQACVDGAPFDRNALLKKLPLTRRFNERYRIVT
jgi:LysR family cys regulon transcriptional activator